MNLETTTTSAVVEDRTAMTTAPHPKKKTYGLIEMFIERKGVDEAANDYIHVVNLNNGREGEVWDAAALLLIEKAESMPFFEFELAMSRTDMSFMGGDISGSVIRELK